VGRQIGSVIGLLAEGTDAVAARDLRRRLRRRSRDDADETRIWLEPPARPDRAVEESRRQDGGHLKPHTSGARRAAGAALTPGRIPPTGTARILEYWLAPSRFPRRGFNPFNRAASVDTLT
jgi:hypothetical protein